jgi:hypothetical protein
MQFRPTHSILKISFIVNSYIIITNNPKRQANVRVKANINTLLSINSISNADLNRLLVPTISNKSLLYNRD